MRVVSEVVHEYGPHRVVDAIHHSTLAVDIELVEVAPLTLEPVDASDGRPVRVCREMVTPEVGDLVLNTCRKPGKRFPDFLINLDMVRRRLVSR